jgi:phage-related protein
MVGGIVGGAAGAKIGHTIAKGTKAVGKFVVNTVRTVASGIATVGKAVASAVGGFFSGVGNFLFG